MIPPRLVAPAAVAVAVLLIVSAAALAKTRVGTARADVLRGTNAADRLYGRGGADRLYGLRGNDRLFGGAGNDRLYAGAGRDRVACGGGRDVAFVDGRDSVAGCETVRRSGATRPPSESPPVLRGGALVPGTYVAPFRPRFRITLGAGWRVEGVPGESGITLAHGTGAERGVLGFSRALAQGRSVAELIADASRAARVTSGPAPVTIGGAPGQRIDIVGPAQLGFTALEAGESMRLWAIDVSGVTIVINARARTEHFAAFVALAEQVLSTVTFES